MRIIMLNWRCPRNPKSGGAEYVTRKHLEAWALAGHEVHWLAGGAKGLLSYEKLPVSGITKEQLSQINPSLSTDNRQLTTSSYIHIHRYGTPISIYLLAPLLYFFKWHMKFDVVIDQIHGIPFLTPLWAWKSRKIAFIHEVAQEIWDEMLPFPINIIGKSYEKIYFWFYNKTPFWVDSNSTKLDLIKYGIPEKNVNVIPCAIDLKPVETVPEKEKVLTLLFVGRLVKMKGVEDAINIFANIKKQYGDAVLWIVGTGEQDYVNHLKDVVKRQNLGNSVIFKGYVSEEEKVRCYQRAHYLIHTSVREGFGLTVLEANSQGTPAIVYDVPGLRDTVKDGENGLKLSKKKLDTLTVESQIYYRLCSQSIKSHADLNWKKIVKQSQITFLENGEK